MEFSGDQSQKRLERSLIVAIAVAARHCSSRIFSGKAISRWHRRHRASEFLARDLPRLAHQRHGRDLRHAAQTLQRRPDSSHVSGHVTEMASRTVL